jgi:hypothetical protein
VFGFGSRNPQMRAVRIGLLVAVVAAGAVFHHSGPTYTAIRIVYFAVVIGFIGFALYRRSVAKHHDPTIPGGPPGYGGPPAPGPSPTIPGGPRPPSSLPPPSPLTPPSAGLNPGWYPDQQDMKVQRYWDGSAWTGTRHWAEDRWIEG